MQQQDNHEYPFLYQRQTCHQVQPNQATYQKRQRSEERFSRNAETDLVCRLLLEKKKLHRVYRRVAASSSSTISAWPARAAQCNPVSPHVGLLSALTPRSNRNLTALVRPYSQAQMKPYSSCCFVAPPFNVPSWSI